MHAAGLISTVVILSAALTLGAPVPDTTRPVEALAGHAPLPRFFGFEINTLFPAVTTLSTALPSATFVQVAPAGTTQFDCMFLPESVREKVSCAPGTTDEPAPEPF